MLRITFLGTGATLPQVERNPSSIAVEISPHNQSKDLLLFDCGEGTQRQMMKYKVGFGSVSSLFVTHLHGDHILGLPGLSQTWTFEDREEPLDIYCPTGTSNYIKDCIELVGHTPQYDIKIHEVENGDLIEREGYSIRIFQTVHTERSIGFCLEEDQRKGKFKREKAEELGVPPSLFSNLHEGESVELENGKVVKSEQVVGPPREGRKIVYTGDTRPNKNTIKFSSEASILIHDGTFDSSMEKRAWETNHSTAKEAAHIAKEAKVEKLVLTHISSRYTNSDIIEKEAKKIFENTSIAKDGLVIGVKYPEKENQIEISKPNSVSTQIYYNNKFTF